MDTRPHACELVDQLSMELLGQFTARLCGFWLDCFCEKHCFFCFRLFDNSLLFACQALYYPKFDTGVEFGKMGKDGLCGARRRGSPVGRVTFRHATVELVDGLV